MQRRTILHGGVAAVAAAAALAAVPSLASAASSCTFDEASKTMTVMHSGSASAPLTLRNSSVLTYQDGNGFAQSCVSPGGRVASEYNVTTIKVKAPTNPAGYQRTILDAHSGEFVTSTNARMKIYVMTGSGGDNLSYLAGGDSDYIRLHTGSGLAIGPAIDLGWDGTDDIGMTMAGSVSVDGGIGDDTLFSKGDNHADSVDGGPDYDTATVDYALDSFPNVEKQIF